MSEPHEESGSSLDAGSLMIPDHLFTEDRATLGELEEVITKGERAFVETGLALARIHDRRLYREAGYKTFEKYCQERWGFTRQRAHQLSRGAVLVAELSTLVNTILPTSEAQTRPLIGLSVNDAGSTWMCAVDMAGDKPVTGRIVREAVFKPFVPLKKKKRKALSDAVAAFNRAGRQLCDRLKECDASGLDEQEKLLLTETSQLLFEIATKAGCWPPPQSVNPELDTLGDVLPDS